MSDHLHSPTAYPRVNRKGLVMEHRSLFHGCLLTG